MALQLISSAYNVADLSFYLSVEPPMVTALQYTVTEK